MAQVKLDLAVSDRLKFDQALDEARTHGLEVSRSFADLGVISGTIEARAIDGLVHIDGIDSVLPKRPSSHLPAQGGATVLPLKRG